MIQYDSDNPDSIPDGVAAAGYCSGYAAAAWNARGWNRFPTARRIAVFPGGNDGDTFDVEWLDLTAEQAPAEVKAAHARGIAVPWVYVNRSNRAAVENSLVLAGILSDQVALWVATLDGTQTVPAGRYPVAAVQYAGSATSGGHYDLSLVSSLFGPGGGSLGGSDMTPQESAFLSDLHAAVSRLEEAFGTATPAGASPTQPNYLGFLNNELRTALSQIADLHNSVGTVGAGLTAAQEAQLTHIETILTTGLKGV